MTSSVKPLAWIMGVLLTLAGLAGLYWHPNLSVFRVDTVVSLYTLIVGLLGIWAAASDYKYAKIYLVSVGIVYAVLTVIGLVNSGDLYVTTVNAPDTYANIVMALLSLIVGFGSNDDSVPTPTMSTSAPPPSVPPTGSSMT